MVHIAMVIWWFYCTKNVLVFSTLPFSKKDYIYGKVREGRKGVRAKLGSNAQKTSSKVLLPIKCIRRRSFAADRSHLAQEIMIGWLVKKRETQQPFFFSPHFKVGHDLECARRGERKGLAAMPKAHFM